MDRMCEKSFGNYEILDHIFTSMLHNFSTRIKMDSKNSAATFSMTN